MIHLQNRKFEHVSCILVTNYNPEYYANINMDGYYYLLLIESGSELFTMTKCPFKLFCINHKLKQYSTEMVFRTVAYVA